MLSLFSLREVLNDVANSARALRVPCVCAVVFHSSDFQSHYSLLCNADGVCLSSVCCSYQPARCTATTTGTALSTRGRILVRYPLSAAAMSYIVWLSLIVLSGCVLAPGSRMFPSADSLSARSVGGN
jgi:hypothetical protein